MGLLFPLTEYKCLLNSLHLAVFEHIPISQISHNQSHFIPSFKMSSTHSVDCSSTSSYHPPHPPGFRPAFGKIESAVEERLRIGPPKPSRMELRIQSIKAYFQRVSPTTLFFFCVLFSRFTSRIPPIQPKKTNPAFLSHSTVQPFAFASPRPQLLPRSAPEERPTPGPKSTTPSQTGMRSPSP